MRGFRFICLVLFVASGAPTIARASSELERGFNIAQSSITILAQRLIPLRLQGILDFSPYAAAAIHPFRTLGVLAELQPVAVLDLAPDVTFQVCLGTRDSAGSVGLKIHM